MSQNTGTLVSSAIRPNDSLDPIASAFANEVKGGHHAYASVTERNAIIVERREWGMLTTVYDDNGDGSTSSNNLTYQLKHNYIDTVITNNLNWVEFSGSGGTGTTDVISITATSSLGFAYTALPTVAIVSYSTEVIYLTTFGITNSASASLNIDGLGDIPIKKITSVGLADVAGGDLIPDINYSLTYDTSNFQVAIPISASFSGNIGPAEDGTYDDGLYTDFTQYTPIGTPIDRFNEILKSLVPPSAPDLSDWSGSKSGSVTGKLSFDGVYGISGSSYISATNSPTSPISVDGTWTQAGKRIGISGSASSDITGILNYQVVANTSVPTPAYIAQSFGDANVGSLKMYVNGILKISASMSLGNLSALDTTTSGTTTGFSVSAATSSKFPGGDPFTLFSYRTGTWLLTGDDSDIVLGYNYVYVVHDNSPSFTRTLSRYEFIIDDSTASTIISGATVSSYVLTGNKALSGVRYFTGGSLRYDVSADNLYKNTYYSSSDAISFSDQSGGTSPILTVSATIALANCVGDEYKQFKISNSDQNGSSLTFSIISSGKRVLNDIIGLNCTAKRTIQGNISGGTASIYNVYLDNVSSSSTALVENFDDETYRLLDTYSGLSYSLISDVTGNTWNSAYSLISATSGYSDGLQVYNSRLYYPSISFNSIGSITTNLNFGDSGVNYSTASGSRVYIRYFRQVTPTTGNFTMVINGSTGTFVPVTTSLTGNNIHVEVKAPGASVGETGWMDAYNDFATSAWADGAGARNASGGVGRSFATTWGLTIGTKNTANTSGYMVVRITVGSSFAGYFDSITWTFA